MQRVLWLISYYGYLHSKNQLFHVKGAASAEASEDGKVPEAGDAKPAAALTLDNSNFEETTKEGVSFVKVGVGVQFLSGMGGLFSRN